MVADIRLRLAAGENCNRLAIAYGISWTNVKDIKIGRIWRHVNVAA